MKHFSMNDDFPVAQLAITILVAFASMLVFMILAVVIAIPFWGTDWFSLMTSGNLENTAVVGMLKYVQIMQSVGVFVLPPVLLAYLFSENKYSYLKVSQLPGKVNLLVGCIVMIASVPLINYMASLNAAIRFPESLSWLEQWFMSKESQAQLVTDAFMNTTSIRGLLLNIFMIGVLAALGEELFFRGILQRIFTNWTGNIHWGILVTSFLFSAIHMQFYGFFPRWILGAFFGYLVVWNGSLWLPIAAHFLNNTLAVILYFLIQKGAVDKKMADIGSSTDVLPYTLFFSMIAIAGVVYLYKNRQTLMPEHLQKHSQEAKFL